MSDAPEHWQRWEMGSLERRAGARPAAARGPDPRQQRREEDARRRAIYEQARKAGMEAGRQQGYEEGFNEGREDGEQQAHDEYANMLAARSSPSALTSTVRMWSLELMSIALS